ncbi:MAG: GFA family protein [Sandaracinaceae bacterium]
MTSTSGSCLCGAVRFVAKGPSLFCAHCHCAWCRKAHGAAFVTWIGYPDDAVELTDANDALVWHRSSEQSRRAFCGTCGTTLFYASILCPGELHVARASIDGPVDKEPSAHIFVEHAVSWFRFDDALPRVLGSHGGLAKFGAVPPRDA